MGTTAGQLLSVDINRQPSERFKLPNLTLQWFHWVFVLASAYHLSTGICTYHHISYPTLIWNVLTYGWTMGCLHHWWTKKQICQTYKNPEGNQSCSNRNNVRKFIHYHHGTFFTVSSWCILSNFCVDTYLYLYIYICI